MPIGALGRLVSAQVAEHDIAWNRAFRGSSGDEISDSEHELEEVPTCVFSAGVHEPLA